ncbi:uncharacterized protein PHALS_14254 [Plasmopara halstedii]|uniref:Uncharacterized protein n=1 Tax=Plasmopara halstedii TaxID=4781 RepID=A0A0N7L6D6_PLAHL|nr:uncharacterized protein PHALS_14254 [Plasmopara halstedii]CEG43979.1 hypothetical protein PHALS_14254 [Plasmopara halstedii]|eukprot:XP_024580348.1 hypothetical protein PHALS_14254 [Plasmopara halstedii]
MWRVKLDHIFNIIVHVALQQEGFLTGEFRVVRLRLGRRWVGAQLLSEDMTDSMKNQWLHRVDYESIDGVQTVESDVFKTVKGVWDKYVADLANPLQRTPDDFNFKESFQSYEKQEKRTSLRVRVMLDTTLKDILSDCRTTFWMPYQFELWLMEQEDAYKYQQFTVGNQHIGSIVNGSYEDLVAIYEMKDMAAEDFGVAWFLE